MQAIREKIRLLGRLTISNLKNVDLKARRDSSINGSGSSFHRILQSSPQLGSNPLLLLRKEFSTETGLSMLFKNNGISQVTNSGTGATPCLSQLAKLMPANRCFSTTGNSVECVPHDASVCMSDVPPRIKFKRLDKTARHIMQEVPENKRRVSIVKGIVIARRNADISTTFRLRRLVAGVGVESLYHLYSPNIKEIKVVDKKKVRRAKLYYLRDKMNALKKH